MSQQQFETETQSVDTLALRELVSAKAEEESDTERLPVQTQMETLAQTLAALVAEAPARKRLRKRLVALCLVGAGVTAGSTLLGVLTSASGWIVFSQFSGFATLGVTSVTVLMILRQLRDPRLQQITDLEDVRAIAPLLDLMENSQEMWEYDDPSRRAIKYALLRLLPRLQASDVSWLTEAQRAALLRTLYYCTHRKYPWHYHPDLAVALLGALEQVGSGDALEYVQELAALAPGDARKEQIREAALACVPFLQIRAREQNAMETLLRASQESTDPNQLLRPHGPEKMNRLSHTNVKE
ncbi:MAG: hypothetical protein JWL77_5866 [Chthonomonadaceae bacterium]|nr:hypothetical protein [Chthonomonadaceae bacterium]